MRFLEDGPSIPEELLLARDEGRVVFFCGSGVSRARADLDDFFGLAGKVLDKLRVPADHATRRLLGEATSIEQRVGLSGLISADRVFALLERDFTKADVEEAVANALQPRDDVDVTAHRIITDLARTEDQPLKLVTTNFDRLFEACLDDPPLWCGPRLPDPSRPEEMAGIIYLHGRVAEDYSGAEQNGFVLSSSEFGRAYLSEGWATEFVRAVIERYVVVFVGYSADDPPIQYLLEALSVQRSHPHGAFAFQEGVSSEASGKWLHKGVRAIPYQPSTGHGALWDTLAAWAEQARDPVKWRADVIAASVDGPQLLSAHLRGQVAHIVSTAQGARDFAEHTPPPSADWLCTFDPRQRYAKPESTWTQFEQGPEIDPFPLFGLDSDDVPQKDPNESRKEREVPTDAWNGLLPNRRDLLEATEEPASPMYGPGSLVPAVLPARLRYLGYWMSRVAGQAGSVWWAARKGGLHTAVQQRIQWQLGRSDEGAQIVDPTVRRCWRYLFQFWDENPGPDHRDWFELTREISNDGWDLGTVRKFVDFFSPYISVEPAWFSGPIPPLLHEGLRTSELVKLDVKYPEAYDKQLIPDEFLSSVVTGLRRNLDRALELEREIGSGGLYGLSPINRDESEDIDGFQRTHGLSGAFINFSSAFAELLRVDVESARSEFRSWAAKNDPIFSRLKVWAAANEELATGAMYVATLKDVPDDIFWDSSFSRDLLLSIRARWPSLANSDRLRIEKRLLRDQSKWEGIKASEVRQRKAWFKLSRIKWLRSEGCEFSDNLRNVEDRLKLLLPDWVEEAGQRAAASTEARGGVVRTDTTHDMLLAASLDDVLDVAESRKGRTENFLVEADPFEGLVRDRPIRALKAIVRAAKRGRKVDWAWREFFESDARSNDSMRMDRLLAARLTSMPRTEVAEFVRSATSWLRSKSEKLSHSFPDQFEALVSKLTSVIEDHPDKAGSALLRGDGVPDWVNEAINSPSGKIAEALMDDPRKGHPKSKCGFDKRWLKLIEELLKLPGDHRRFAYVIFCYNLNWFYANDPSWTTRHLISAVEGEDVADRDAFWSGFLWGAKIPSRELFVILKPRLLAFAGEEKFARRGYGDILAGIVLAGWGTTFDGQRLITSEEMQDLLLRSDESFRSRILRQLRIWVGSSDDNAQQWKRLAPIFFDSVWPKQKFIRTPRMSSNLVDVLFQDAAAFPGLVEVILPILTPVEAGDFTVMPSVRSEVREPDIVSKYPGKVLDVLYAVLSDQVQEWPYEADKILEKIGETDPALRNNPKLVELNRRWNSR